MQFDMLYRQMEDEDILFSLWSVGEFNGSLVITQSIYVKLRFATKNTYKDKVLWTPDLIPQTVRTKLNKHKCQKSHCGLFNSTQTM